MTEATTQKLFLAGLVKMLARDVMVGVDRAVKRDPVLKAYVEPALIETAPPTARVYVNPATGSGPPTILDVEAGTSAATISSMVTQAYKASLYRGR